MSLKRGSHSVDQGRFAQCNSKIIKCKYIHAYVIYQWIIGLFFWSSMLSEIIDWFCAEQGSTIKALVTFLKVKRAEHRVMSMGEKIVYRVSTALHIIQGIYIRGMVTRG